jgi:hypothetical protein
MLAEAIMERRIALGNDRSRKADPWRSSLALPLNTSIAHVILPLAAVEATGAQATFFESFCRSRTGIDHCARVSRSAPCRRGRCDRRGARAFRTDNPSLRLRVTSKARQVVEIIIAPHDTPPRLDALGTRGDIRPA